MAILNNLIVNGAARFLNKSYFDSLEADNGAFKKIIAKDATVTNATVMGLLDVTGELHTKSWSNSNIATIDGSFYITPTFGLQGGDTSTNTVTVAATSLSFTNSSGTNFNFDSLYLDGSSSAIAWTTSSKVIVTGEILKDGEWIPLGTLKGTLSTYSTTSVVINSITDAKGAAPATLAALIGSGLRYRNVKVSLISIYRESKLRPLGIFMTATGANGRTFLDIYGGSNEESSTYLGLAKPVVRIGNLSSSSLNTVAGITPTGWGIYTSNGFFTGTIAAEKGKIGTGSTYWTIGSSSTQSYIYAGASGPTTVSANTAGIYVGTDGINNYNSSTQYVRITGGKITAVGADIKGAVEATSFVAKDYYNSTYRTRAVVDTNGLTVYDGSGTAAANIQARFGSTVQIGTSSGNHVNITNEGISIEAGTGGIFKVEKLSGNYNVCDVFYVTADNKTSFTLTYTAIDNNYKVFVNDTEVSPTKTTTGFTFSSALNIEDKVAVYYATNKSTQSFTLGSRSYNQYVENATSTYYDLRGDQSAAIGNYLVASGPYSFSQGKDTIASGQGSSATGWGCLASGEYAKAEGYFTTAAGRGSHAEGSHGIAIGTESHVEGYGCVAINSNGHAEGSYTKAESDSSHAEGQNTHAKGGNAHAEGYNTKAYGFAAHAEGSNTSTAWSYGYEHAEGYYTKATAQSAHSEGEYTEANGFYSHSQNHYTIAEGHAQTVMGDYNVADAVPSEVVHVNKSYRTHALIIGNGTANNARSNALALDWNGNLKIKGNIYIGCNADSSGGTQLTGGGGSGTNLISYGTEDLTAGSSSLATGHIYCVYE